MALPPPNSRERVFVALWNLILANQWIKSTFVTTGRYLIDLANITRDQMPALFLIQHGEKHVKGPPHGLSAKRTMDASIVVYGWTPLQSQLLPATLLNNMMDSLDLLFEYPPNPANVQTLGGLVDHVVIEGQVVMIEGELATGESGSVMVVPLQIMLP